MTIYGGWEPDPGGTIKDGFFISCTKCGWHSKVEMKGSTLICYRCGNKYEGNNKEESKDTPAQEGNKG